ncbi:MAG: TRAP transporter large permease [Pseudomonadales bacterium]|jgi:tripartite ATP-independent transporter DctM subunit|nr:TRAP transporter large permease [Pseudomonadales bacterium]|tara:strand:+ start:8114 stop:9415 length:1302 start_codon:yes stop_codon:yes gene_type:complete
MEAISIALAGILIMFSLIALHVPVGVSLAVTGVGVFTWIVGFDEAVSLIGTEFSATFSNMDYSIIPFFIVMGSLASTAGLSADLFRLANSFLGHKRGGLALATVGGCAAFGSVCGSSLATVATMTRVALPEMLKQGYKPSLATGSIAAGGALGTLIPPSLIIVLYALLTDLDTRTLMIAAIMPALLAVVMNALTIIIMVRLNPDIAPKGEPTSWNERGQTLVSSWQILLLGGIVAGGIYGGIFNITEAAAVGVVIAFIMCFFRGQLTQNNLREMMQETASNTAMIYMMLIGASILSYFLSLSHMPEYTVAWIDSMDLPAFVVILVLYLMYLVLGSIFETVAAMVITLPFVLPIVTGLGYDPIWWGIMMLSVIGTGMNTPPIGMNVFVLFGMTRDIPLKTIFSGTLPFVISDVIKLLILTMIPEITLWLPSLIV